MSQYIGRTSLAHARAWHHIDLASDPRAFGRIASSIAVALMGKHKPTFHPSNDCGDFVVVTNCQHLTVTGKKLEHKKYRTHSGMIGHLKEVTMGDLLQQKGGGEILKKAVSGMLPKNRLRKLRIERLRTFEGSENPYADNILATSDMVPDIEAFKSAQEATPVKKVE